MQPNPYTYNPYAYNPYVNGGQMPVRYAIPPGYRQPSPPYANQAYASMPAATRPSQNVAQPVRYPPGYRPGYFPPGMPMPPANTMMPVGTFPRPQQHPQSPQRNQSEQLQPPQPYYYNPYGENHGGLPDPKAAPPKKGAKEYKDNAFTIAPDGAHSESIKGLVSNNDINDLLKHKGTKVKVSKIYRITKTKPNIVNNDSSDDDLPLPNQKPQPVSPTRPPPSQPIQRPISSSSSDSHCSTCSNCSCSDCRDRQQSHVYDDCPDCLAELSREQARRQRRK